MVCTANDVLVWKDFPKGLRVLLLDEDSDSASLIRSKLKEMDYIVSIFCNENEALLALSNKLENFHIAIVEVSTSNSNGIFKFLETANELPTIMTSKIHCLNTIMKCIALGAVEFLQKPLSEDKLRNIWQHVVHKAFKAKGSVISEPVKPIKESVVSMLQLQLENGEQRNPVSVKVEDESRVHENNHDQSAGSDKYPAPSTPQLEQGGRLLVDGDCQDQTNFSSEKECGEQDGESKSVETTCGNLVAGVAIQDDLHERSGEVSIKVERDLADAPKSENNTSLLHQIQDNVSTFRGCAESSAKAGLQNRGASKANRKLKVDWTPDLHKKFVKALEDLGVDQAIPSRILELMKVEGLTRHNVASHLQKYRMHQRHILPKQDDGRWPHHRDTAQSVYYPHKPIMAYPLYHSPHTGTTGQVYPVWGQPSSHPSSFQVWCPPSYPAWHWNPYSDACSWGCPVMTPPHVAYPNFPPITYGIHDGSGVDSACVTPQTLLDLHPAEDVIDKAVREATTKPRLPLPIGLKPPSVDTVLAELSKQGISTVPQRGSNLS